MKTQVPVTVRWSDLDAYGHVNNVAIMALLEEARVALFWHSNTLATPEQDAAAPPGAAAPAAATPAAATPAGGAQGDGFASARDLASFVVRQEIEYLRPLGYPSGPLAITIWVSHVGASSIEVCYEVPTLDGGVAARAMTTVIMVDPDSGRPRSLNDHERAPLLRMLDEPVQFRRREGT